MRSPLLLVYVLIGIWFAYLVLTIVRSIRASNRNTSRRR